MLKIFLFAIFILTLTANSVASAAEEYTPTISVSGEGVVEAPPDSATISIGVMSRDKDAEKVQAANAQIAANVIKSIAALGIERKNIRTGNYNFRQLYRTDENNRRFFDAYEVTNTVTIFVNDINKVGKVIDAALSNGANEIDSLNFSLRDREKFQSEALRLAVIDAQKKAEIAAAALGKVIVGVRNVSINSASIVAPRSEKFALMSSNDRAFDTPIESGTLSCSASVHIEFEISR